MNRKYWLKLIGKYVTYLGHFAGVAGIVWGNLSRKHQET